MHLQQTKRRSIATGGPQYYFHDLSDPVLTYLRAQGAVRVALVTPYGATKSDFFAVGKDHKLVSAAGEVTIGKVGHDRIQQGKASGSIGEAIRDWYRLSTGNFERIDVDGRLSRTSSTCDLSAANMRHSPERSTCPLSNAH